MKCPFCQHADTRVVDSRPAEEGNALRRRRECESCGGRFTTHERYASTPLMVVKKDGRREEFSIEKLRSGIAMATNKRPVSADAVNSLVLDVEKSLRREGGQEINSERIGVMVMERLYELDQVAYVRFASVYQRFDDVRLFAQLLQGMSRQHQNGRLSRGKKSKPIEDNQLSLTVPDDSANGAGK